MKTILNNSVLLLFLLWGCANGDMNLNGGEEDFSAVSGVCFPEVRDKYTYPVRPGMKEWQTSDDVFKLVQLPDRVLKSVSTPALIDALVCSPLFTDFYLLSSSPPLEAWHRHYERFNSALELFKRDDAGKSLVKYYQATRFDCIESQAGDENFRPLEVYERIFGLEFLFTRQEILNTLEHQDRQALVEALLSKYEQKPERWVTVVPMAHVMLDSKYPPVVKYSRDNSELYSQSLGSGYVFPGEQSGLIISFANSFIKEK